MAGPTIWQVLFRGMRFQLGRMYDTFYNAQYNNKYVLLFALPPFIWSVRYRAETKLGYHVFITDEELYPDWSSNVVSSKWENGKKYYMNDIATASDLKREVYGSAEAVPAMVKVGCRGRMMDDSDNLAAAVRAFCKRDPRLVMWKDDIL
eukprot:GHVU01154065.1.p1 GENE.GHVU01154065.1~~GHVU01154065.1.p1  ORF type:complete len:149 (+),score=19.74 GHVU01154065.1:190-636(+)